MPSRHLALFVAPSTACNTTQRLCNTHHTQQTPLARCHLGSCWLKPIWCVPRAVMSLKEDIANDLPNLGTHQLFQQSGPPLKTSTPPPCSYHFHLRSPRPLVPSLCHTTSLAHAHTTQHPPDTTSMLCRAAAAASGPCLHTTYSYGTRFMPSRVAVTTATSATCRQVCVDME